MAAGRVRRTVNEDRCVEAAFDVMVCRGWIDEEYAGDETLERELRRLYRTGPEIVRAPIKIKPDDDVLTIACKLRTADTLARLWEYEQELRWQREEAPRAQCGHCGTLVSPWQGLRKQVHFYSLNEAGEYLDLVTACPGCDRPILAAVEYREQPTLFEGGGSSGGRSRGALAGTR